MLLSNPYCFPADTFLYLVSPGRVVRSGTPARLMLHNTHTINMADVSTHSTERNKPCSLHPVMKGTNDGT